MASLGSQREGGRMVFRAVGGTPYSASVVLASGGHTPGASTPNA